MPDGPQPGSVLKSLGTLANRRDVLLTGAAVGVSLPLLSQPVARDTLGPPHLAAVTGTLRERADAKRLLCGSAVRASQLARDPRLRAVLAADCNILVPENELKWEVIQPTPDVFDFTLAEEIYQFAASHRMAMRGHTLTWRQSEPRWAVPLIGGMSASAAEAFLRTYVTKVVGHWRGRIAQWDVANEPVWINDSLSEPLFTKTLGDRYLDIAFHAARAADPDALLVLNHDGTAQATVQDGQMRAAFLRLLDRLKARGVPIDAIGFEGHLSTGDGFNQEEWRRFLDHIRTMGLKIVVTEFDVADTAPGGTVARRDAEVAALATAFLDVTLDYPNCLGLLCWGMEDRDSWLHDLPERQRADGRPLRPTPRDGDYRPKLLWRAIAAALERARPRGSPAQQQQ